MSCRLAVFLNEVGNRWGQFFRKDETSPIKACGISSVSWNDHNNDFSIDFDYAFSFSSRFVSNGDHILQLMSEALSLIQASISRLRGLSVSSLDSATEFVLDSGLHKI